MRERQDRERKERERERETICEREYMNCMLVAAPFLWNMNDFYCCKLYFKQENVDVNIFSPTIKNEQ